MVSVLTISGVCANQPVSGLCEDPFSQPFPSSGKIASYGFRWGMIMVAVDMGLTHVGLALLSEKKEGIPSWSRRLPKDASCSLK